MKIGMYFLSVAALVAVVVGQAGADDFAPPPWRDLAYPYSTLQAWEFSTPASPATPDDPGVTLLIGDGGTDLGPPGSGPVAEFFGLTWDPGDGDGGWVNTMPPGPPDEFILFHVPNWIDFLPRKLIRVQVVFLGDPGTPPIVSAIDGEDNVLPGPILGFPAGPPVVIPLPTLGSGYFGYFQDFEMQPNPDWERIQLFVPSDILIDQVVIDTISIPEPASVAMLAVGGLTMLRRRR